MPLTAKQFARMCDAVAISGNQTFDSQRELAEYAKKYDFYLIFGQASAYPYLIDSLKGSNTLVGGGVGWGTGNGTDQTEQKVFAAKRFLELGCADIDMWMNISYLRCGMDDKVYDDVKAVRDVVPADHTFKVIIEAPILAPDEILRACDILKAAKADYVKSGAGVLGTCTVEHAKLMIRGADGKLKVKCAGGIRDVATVEEMVNLGVNRIGMGYKSAAKIYEELAAREN